MADTSSEENPADEIADDKVATQTAVSNAVDRHGHPPLQLEQEWANALTHGIGATCTAVLGTYLVLAAMPKGTGLAIACSAYIGGAFGTFLFSTLSHVILRQPWLNTMRTWDQAMIYAMIAGTYTPIVYRFATDAVRTPLLTAIWIAAGAGFLFKVGFRHRINSSGTISYLLLGWLPAIPLAGQVPGPLVSMMVLGGVLYTIGVVFLINDWRIKYFHAAWHVSVMAAAAAHYLGILNYVVLA